MLKNTKTTTELPGAPPVSSIRIVSPVVLPPDQVQEAMLALHSALQACKKADWKRTTVVERVNATMLVDLIIHQLG